MSDTTQAAVSLEERLEGDKSGTVSKETLDVLSDYEGKLKAEISKGLPAEEYEVIQGLLDATKRAQTVVKTAWKYMHEKKA